MTGIKKDFPTDKNFLKALTKHKKKIKKKVPTARSC